MNDAPEFLIQGHFGCAPCCQHRAPSGRVCAVAANLYAGPITHRLRLAAPSAHQSTAQRTLARISPHPSRGMGEWKR
jgi:hypothetical protein